MMNDEVPVGTAGLKVGDRRWEIVRGRGRRTDDDEKDAMRRDEVKKGVRVVFRGPVGEVIAPLYEAEKHKLAGRLGRIVYGISEDVWCYPDDPTSDMVWVAFEDDRMPRRQVSAAWLEKAEEGQPNIEH